MSDAFVRPAAPSERSAFSVSELVAEHVGPVSFSVAVGEPLGLVGLRGAGHHTVGRAIFGHTPTASGRLTLDGKPIAPLNPAEAMANGIGFVSSRRAEEGLRVEPGRAGEPILNPAASGKGVLELMPRAASSAKRKLRSGASPSRRPVLKNQSRLYPVAISRRWSSRAGWRLM